MPPWIANSDEARRSRIGAGSTLYPGGIGAPSDVAPSWDFRLEAPLGDMAPGAPGHSVGSGGLADWANLGLAGVGNPGLVGGHRRRYPSRGVAATSTRARSRHGCRFALRHAHHRRNRPLAPPARDQGPDR